MTEEMHKKFKEKYDLDNKEEVMSLLIKHGIITGYKDDDEYWILPDKTAVKLNTDNNTVKWFGEEYNSEIINDIRDEFFRKDFKES